MRGTTSEEDDMADREGEGMGRDRRQGRGHRISTLLLGMCLAWGVTGGAGPLFAETVIQFATYGSTVDEWERMAAAFTRTHPGIQVGVQVYPFGEYIDKITTMVASGSPPDLFQTWAQYKSSWVEAGILRDLTPLWQRSSVLKNARIYPFMLDAASYNGRIYGVPYDYNSELWFVNLDWLSQRGLSAPRENWTVEEMREMAQKLTDPAAGVYGATNPVSAGWGQNIQWMINWTGHGWLSEDRTEVLVDDPRNVEMLQFWYDMEHNLLVTPYPGGFPARGDFWNGGYAMWQGWLSYAFRFGETPAYDWGLALYPAAPGGGQQAFAQGHMFSIPTNAAHPDEAWQMLEWMGSYEGQRAIVRENNREPIGPYDDLWTLFFDGLPPRKAEYVRSWLLNVLYGKGYARNMTYWNTFPQMNAIMGEHLGNAFAKRVPIANAMAAAAAEMRAVLREHGAR
ncbi:MAG TPA: sugar ABC transporter substrate-binding protein [Limnochordia bacterium]